MSRAPYFFRALAVTAVFTVLYLSANLVMHVPSPGAEQFTLKSADGKITYVINVWLPKSYPVAARSYPLLLVLDGEYAFDSAVQISDALQRSGEIDEFIVVGVSYDVGFGEPLAAERTRDFTPPLNGANSIAKQPTAYYRFLKEILLPQLEKRYRISPGNRALWSYSLSGSFAAWLNYFDPSLFDHYIVASGNLLGFGIFPELAHGRIFSSSTYHDRRVIFSYDATEIPDAKFLEDGRKLLAREDLFAGYQLKLLLTQNESHASSWFAAMPASLRYIFGKTSPANSPP